MKKLLFLLVIAAGAYFGYQHYMEHGSFSFDSFAKKSAPAPGPPITPSGHDINGQPLMKCPTCAGSGQLDCSVIRCDHGKVDCTGRCLRLSSPGWTTQGTKGTHGYDPNTLYMVFHLKKGRTAVSQAHIGEVWEVRDGVLINHGVCKVCNGSTKISCKVCGGTGIQACRMCHGNKVIYPKAPATAPVQAVSLNSAPPSSGSTGSGGSSSTTVGSRPPPTDIEAIRLTNGKTVRGKVIVRDGTVVWVRGLDGKTVELKESQILK